jgi:hypothetical protein
MANTSRINGLRPVFHMGGGELKTRKYFIPSTDGTAVYPGDVVKLAGSADTDGTAPTIQLASAADSVVGVVAFFEPNRDNLNITGQYRAASTDRYAYVWDDPMIVFVGETSNGTAAAVDVGLNINHATGTPNTATARSGAYLDVGSKAATSTLTFQILAFASNVDNEVAASARLYVKINKHQLAPGGQYDAGGSVVVGVLGT